jgi:Rieske Fe-S protein
VVPWQENDPVEPRDKEFAQKGRFNCPCHGSIYDRYGDIVAGPAPRPMYRFPLSIVNGRVVVDTNPTTAIVRQKVGPEDALPPG